MNVRPFAAILSILLVVLALPVAQPARAQAQNSLALVSELQKGGHVIFFRHGATDKRQADTDVSNLDNCATQRNLVDYGRQQSQMIGAGFKALRIPVGEVVSSNFCRCMETAKIAFGRATPDPTFASYMQVSDEEKRRRVNYLAGHLNAAPKPGTNTVLVGHHLMFEEASGGVVLEEGEGAVLKPSPKGPVFVARIRAEGWQQVVDQLHAATGP